MPANIHQLRFLDHFDGHWGWTGLDYLEFWRNTPGEGKKTMSILTFDAKGEPLLPQLGVKETARRITKILQAFLTTHTSTCHPPIIDI